jgi:hypothetical protein
MYFIGPAIAVLAIVAVWAWRSANRWQDENPIMDDFEDRICR